MIRLIRRELFRLRKLKFSDYIAHLTSRDGQRVLMDIMGEQIWIRKGTPDLKAALQSFNDEFQPLKELLPPEFDGLIIDAGGYIGTAAIKLAGFYPSATVISIEASRANFEMLALNTKRFNNVHRINAALSCGESKFATLSNRGTGEWGFTIVNPNESRSIISPMETVETISIKDIQNLYPSSPIAILKLDIEGAEKELFEQSKDSLSIIPVIFVELHDKICDGCTSSFEKFSASRFVEKSRGEKYISINRSLLERIVSSYGHA